MKLGSVILAVVICLMVIGSLCPLAQAADNKVEIEVTAKVVSPHSVTTTGAWPVGTTWAILRGRLTGATSSVKVYFEYGTDTTYGSTTRVRTIRHPRPFVAFIRGLSPDTTYHFRAVAKGHGTIVYGDEISFTTKKQKRFWWWFWWWRW